MTARTESRNRRVDSSRNYSSTKRLPNTCEENCSPGIHTRRAHKKGTTRLDNLYISWREDHTRSYARRERPLEIFTATNGPVRIPRSGGPSDSQEWRLRCWGGVRLQPQHDSRPRSRNRSDRRGANSDTVGAESLGGELDGTQEV